ncbi:MAG: PD-(D/E)XK nuclease family protein [Gemmatimonadetes bacterium]|nr:PD-(D/E)XK nuclease family protein [Gemmatimonadota bacterium]
MVFWADLGRMPPQDRGESLLVGRERVALKDADLETREQDAAYLALLAGEQAEALAERKRLWYVAATRARDLLVVSGFQTGEQQKESAAARILPLLQRERKDRFRFQARSGHHEGAVRPVALEGAPTDAAAPAPLPAVEIPAPLPPLTVSAGRGRHSATELMAHERCPRRRWLRYVAGLREPAVERSGGAFLGAVARGSLVHDVLEHAREGLEYETALEAAIGRWDPAAPRPTPPRGRAIVSGSAPRSTGSSPIPAIARSARRPRRGGSCRSCTWWGPGWRSRGRWTWWRGGPAGTPSST